MWTYRERVVYDMYDTEAPNDVLLVVDNEIIAAVLCSEVNHRKETWSDTAAKTAEEQSKAQEGDRSSGPQGVRTGAA